MTSRMMNYRSIADMNALVYDKLGLFPDSIGLVAGIPRSGLLAANMISLALNVPLTDLEGLFEGRIFASGKTRRYTGIADTLRDGQTVLVVDDSIRFGDSMREARKRLAPLAGKYDLVFCACYGSDDAPGVADIVLETVPSPRIFEWNLFHHKFLAGFCLLLEGVVFPAFDIEREEAVFAMPSALPPRIVPSAKVGHLLSLRGPEHRERIESRLRELGIEFDHLHFRDPAETVDTFAARVYRSAGNSTLMILSHDRDVPAVVRETGKPVLSLESQTLVDMLNVAALEERSAISAIARMERRIRREAGARSAPPRVVRFITKRLGLA